MDELKLETGFTRKLVSGILERSIRKRYGYSIKLDLDKFNATIIDGKAHVTLSASAEMDAKQLSKMFE